MSENMMAPATLAGAPVHSNARRCYYTCMAQKRMFMLACVLFLLGGLSSACGVLDGVTSTMNGGTKSGTVDKLWADVPPMQGATQADLGLPSLAQLAIRGISQGKFEFIAYTTERSGDDVANYYSKEAMQAAGWTANDQPGCTSGMIGGSNQQQGGAFCVFGRKQEGKDMRLIIIALADDKTKKTQLYYVRVDASASATPTP